MFRLLHFVTIPIVSIISFLHRYIGLEVLSCWRDVELEGGSLEGNAHLQIGHNHFMYNEAVATKLAPLVRTFGRIEHNDYKHNKDGMLTRFFY